MSQIMKSYFYMSIYEKYFEDAKELYATKTVKPWLILFS